MTKKYADFITEQQKHNSLRTIKEAKEAKEHSFDDGHHYDKAMDTQHKMITAKYGKRAADEANYGWGEGKHSITTKIYSPKRSAGRILLHTRIDPTTGAHDHQFRGDDD